MMDMYERSQERVKDLESTQVQNQQQIAAYEAALDLALAIMGRWEPGDVRAISEEFVSIAAIRCGCYGPDMVGYALGLTDKINSLPPPEPAEVKIESLGEWEDWNYKSGPPWRLWTGDKVDIDTGDGRTFEDREPEILDWERVWKYRTRKVIS